MGKNLKVYKKKLLIEKGYLYNSFNKKIIKEIFLLKRKKIYNLKRIIKIIIYMYIYSSNYLFNKFFLNYNLVRNILFLFFNLYSLVYEKIKLNLKHLFDVFLKKTLIKFLLKIGGNIKKKKVLIFFNLKLNSFFDSNIEKNIKKNIRWRKKFLNVTIPIKKKLKKIISNKVKIRITHSFFNLYKFNLFLMLIKYFNKIFRFKLIREFIFYWKRYYTYYLKRLFLFIEYILTKYFDYIIQEFKFFFSFINFKKINRTKYKPFFLYLYIFKKHPYRLLKHFKFYSYFNNASKLLRFNYLKTNHFNLFFFFGLKRKLPRSIFFFNKKLEQLKFLVKIKFFLFIKNFFILFIIWFLKYWLNYYYFFMWKNNNNLIDIKNNLFSIENIIKIGIVVIESKKWNRISFSNFNFFFYNNIIIKKSDEIGKRINF